MDPNKLIAIFDQLKSERGNFNNLWQELADLIWPQTGNFISHQTNGQKRTEHIYDSTAPLALPKAASARNSLLTPKSQQWHELKSSVKSLNEVHAVKEYFEQLNNLLFEMRYSDESNFDGQKLKEYMSISLYGNGCLFVDSVPGVIPIRYRAIDLAECYIIIDADGRVTGVIREYKLSAHQIRTEPMFEGNVPANIANSSHPYSDKYTLLHVVKQRDDYDPERVDEKGMRFESGYVLVDQKLMLSEGGYNTMPYIFSRELVSGSEIYGRGMASTVLPEVSMLNEMRRSDIKSTQLLAEPPLLFANRGLFGANSNSFDLKPNAPNLGLLDQNGTPLVQHFVSSARVDINEEKMDIARQTINDAFLVGLFQILADNPQMTATEATIRAQEKAALITPVVGVHQSEALTLLIKRELDLLGQQGLLPAPPSEMLNTSVDYEIVFDAPLNRLQKLDDVAAFERTIAAAAPLLQLDPKLIEIFDGAETLRMIAEINGVPASVMRSRAEYDERLKELQQQIEQAQAADQAPGVARASRDLAEAEKVANG